MKKIITSLMALSLIFSAAAQDGEVLKNKNGAAILPIAGDWGLGFNASPALNYVGNLLGSSGMNSIGSAWDNSKNAISGKYFKDANTAYRGQLRIGFSSAKVDSNQKTTSNNIVLAAGIEKRRGYGRLVGYYGGDVMIGLSGGKDSYEYDATFSSSRLIEEKQSGTFSFGLMGVAGVEYFVLPRLSLGMEYTWGLLFASNGESETTTETAAGENTTVKGDKSSDFSLDTGNNAGSIRLMFYF
jgi:hypothetical protein